MTAGSHDYEYCVSLVREGDPDRFSMAMLADPIDRRSLIALLAFNLEVAKIRDAVKETLLGEMRLHWWRDVIQECCEGRARRHQVVQPLEETILKHRLPAFLFQEILEARSREFETLPPADEKELMSYIDQTGGALGELLFRSLLNETRTPDKMSCQQARAAGRAWSWVGIARAMYLQITAGRKIVPATWPSDKIQFDIRHASPTEDVLSWCRWLLEQADQDRQQVTRNLPKTVRALSYFADIYSRQLRDVDHNPFVPETHTMTRLRRGVSLIKVSCFARY